MSKKSINQTYFVVEVENSGKVEYLGYESYLNSYTLKGKQQATQFNEQKDAEEVAHFYAKLSAVYGTGHQYRLIREQLSSTIIELEKRDYLEGHKVEVDDQPEVTIEG